MYWPAEHLAVYEVGPKTWELLFSSVKEQLHTAPVSDGTGYKYRCIKRRNTV
jgi:hypothetical protein